MKIATLILLSVLACSCDKFEATPKFNPPSDHTVSKDGTMHKSGLDEPNTNCTTCHGSDLQGGTSGVSCFQCHDNEWE